jgi:hypothetical protein
MNVQFKRALVGLAAITLVAGASTQGIAAVRQPGQPTEPEKNTLRAGVQLAPKSNKAPTTIVNGKEVVVPNPYLANLPDATKTDWTYWRDRADALGKQRAKSPNLAIAKNRAAGRTLASPLVHDELEPDEIFGSNDSLDNAEPIIGFGTGATQNPRVRVLGTFPDLAPESEPITPGAEDNGAIPLATATGIGATGGAITTTGVLGDGPHGSTGTGRNDFDFYQVTAPKGFALHADTEGTAGALDTVIGVYSAAGQLLAADDDGGTGLLSNLNFDVPATGDYFVVVAGFTTAAGGPFPEDPNDSGSGFGGGDEGPYNLAVSASPVDRDFYKVRLRKGDVLGGSVVNSARRLVVHRPDGSQSQGTAQDASFLYPPSSPLPGGGNAVLAYVAEEPGWYAVSVENGVGNYDATLEVYRPGAETDTKQQTIFLDFDGARVNTAIWGGPGVRQLSPFSAFIARWGLPRSAESALINRIIANVTENVKQDLIAKGLNPNVAVRILNSRDHADPFGRPNVNRVIIGGTIPESGINTIGIAQYIDPGNYGHEDSALVLLDAISDPAGVPFSINTYLNASSDKLKFVSQVVGNITSHEIGHFIGSYHVDQFNDVFNLMDQGGNFPLLFGVGPDNVGGTADDVDVDFGEDIYNPNEGFTGIEDTLNISAWAHSKPRG